MEYHIKPLPPGENIESIAVLKQLNLSHKALATLNGRLATIPNENTLINTLALQEAKDSSAVENIITTHDELYQTQINEYFKNESAKEVSRYADALKEGFYQIREHKIISNSVILNIQKVLEQNEAGYRKLPGTNLINERTGDTVYTPPQDYNVINSLMANLINFINDERLSDLDPLVKMALIHHQFESIHPFYDGNGRTGRILNILYLVQQDLLELPVLYLSRYIIQHKNQYYQLLQSVRDTGNWEPWLLYILKGVEETSKQTLSLIENIKIIMSDYKHRIRKEFPKLYSQDLLNNLFKHPYTKIEFIMQDLNVIRLTASKYLEMLTKAGYLEKVKIGRSNFYINTPLFNLLKEGVKPEESTDMIISKHI